MKYTFQLVIVSKKDINQILFTCTIQVFWQDLMKDRSNFKTGALSVDLMKFGSHGEFLFNI